jgi:hypothetical protein
MVMVAHQEHGSTGDEQRRTEAAQRQSMSWPAMLAWILGAFVLAGLVAYRLVMPFFHRG